MMNATTLAQANIPVNPKLEAALKLARAGFKVFPLGADHPADKCEEKLCSGKDCPRCRERKQRCSCSAKAPLGLLVRNGYHDATVDEQIITGWWLQYPQANIGLPCRDNGIVVIDLDTHDAAHNGFTNWQKVKGSNELPLTPMQETPGGIDGGCHILLGHPSAPVSDAIRLLDESTGELAKTGIDVKSNGYIVVSPSVVHGKPYEWHKNLLEVAPAAMPAWLLPQVQRAERTSPPAESAQAAAPSRQLSDADRVLVLQALEALPADDRKIWIDVGMALKAHGFDYEVWEQWSQKSDNYRAGDCQKEWKSFRRHGIKIGTLFYYAKQHGFRFPENHFPRTDIGNAARLAFNYGHMIRWCPPEKRWYAWDGTRWIADNTERPIHYAKETARAMFAAAADDDQRKWAAQSASAPKVKAMLELAKPDLAITPDMLDLDPWLLNCNNGTVDLRTGTLREHQQEDFITKLCPVDYDGAASAPRFQQFLSEIMGDSSELVEFIQCALGYSLTGATTEQKLFVAYGSGQNGKSTLCTAIRETMGTYALETDPNLLTRKERGTTSEDVYQLKGARLATTIESDEDVRLNEAKLKQLTGGDQLNACLKYGHLTNFDPTHKLWLVTNHLPTVTSQGMAIWRRIRLIPFNVQIPDDRKDPQLPEKLRAEYPGILAWLVEGCLKWLNGGLPEPAEVVHATSQYREDEDQLARFISDCCYLDPDAKTQASALHAAYKMWCQRTGEIECSRKAFPKRLQEKGLSKKPTGPFNVWCGIGIKAEADETVDSSDAVLDATLAAERPLNCQPSPLELL